MSFKSFLHWLASMFLSPLPAWYVHNHPGTGVDVPTIFGVGCASHWIGHVGGKPDDATG